VGELTELRPSDLHMPSGMVTVPRVVTEVKAAFHPEGGRFLVKPYPKNKRSRRFKLDQDLVQQNQDHITRHRLAPEDLLFRFDTFLEPDASPRRLQSVEALGLTEPNAAGRRYAHRPMSAYTQPEDAGASIAEQPSRLTAPSVEKPATMHTAARACATPTVTCLATGSATRYGNPPATGPASTHGLGYTTCATRTLPGCSLAAPTSRSLRSGSAMAASPPPGSISTPRPPRTRPHSLRCAAFVSVPIPRVLLC
jgi:hypothetical protein